MKRFFAGMLSLCKLYDITLLVCNKTGSLMFF